MYLRKLQINLFKNCENADLFLSEKINCFVGNNGAGKTNILDAIYTFRFVKAILMPSISRISGTVRIFLESMVCITETSLNLIL